MKKVLALLLLSFSSVAFAQHHGHRWHHGHHHHRHWSHNWVVPAIIGGTVVYAATRPTPTIVQQPTIVLQPNQVLIDGVIYTKQIMIINGVETEVLVKAG